MSSLRSLLQSGRISKTKPKSKSSSPRKQSNTGTSPKKQTQPTSASPRKQGRGEQKHDEADDSTTAAAAAYDIDDDLFEEPLSDLGLVAALATDLSLRDVPQAMAHARGRMFTPIPTSAATGMSSTRLAQINEYRTRNLPPLVSVSHVHAVLASSPSAVEREIAELEGKAVLRRVRVGRGRGGSGRGGEALILADDLESLVKEATELSNEAKEWFSRFLKENGRVSVVARGTQCQRKVADELVRAGFLTGRAGVEALPGIKSKTSATYNRPEDRASLTSVEAVSRAPSGSMAAVGGSGAVLLAGGGGGAPRLSGSGSKRDMVSCTLDHDYSIAVPGQGPFFKLAVGAVEHVVSWLDKASFKEMPESMLKERWDGGVASDEARMARKARGQFAGVLPGKTKKWKEFWGLDFAWVLEEAMGMGAVEVFETGSVGRGVRKL